jgi:hypothetical protein
MLSCGYTLSVTVEAESTDPTPMHHWYCSSTGYSSMTLSDPYHLYGRTSRTLRHAPSASCKASDDAVHDAQVKIPEPEIREPSTAYQVGAFHAFQPQTFPLDTCEKDRMYTSTVTDVKSYFNSINCGALKRSPTRQRILSRWLCCSTLCPTRLSDFAHIADLNGPYCRPRRNSN